jgi:hypothetical protein
MIKVRLIDTSTGKDLHTYDDPSGHPTLVTTDYGRLHGTFASAVGGAGVTTTVIAANGGEGITLTDLIVNIEKAPNSVATVQVTDADGSGPVILAVVASDEGSTLAIPFQGNFATWKAARIEVVAVTSAANVTVGYFRTPAHHTPTFDEWDATR